MVEKRGRIWRLQTRDYIRRVGQAIQMKFSARSELATIALGVALLAATGGVAWWALSGGSGAVAQNTSPRERVVPVLAGKAERKDVPYRLEALGTVQPLISLPVRSRVDSQIEKVHFKDGDPVKAGDILFTLDSRTIEAQLKQSEAQLARDQAQLEKALRDVERISGLLERKVASPVQLADARTNADVLKATVAQDEAQLQNLRVLRSYYEIHSPVTGRIGVSGVRPGTVVRATSDTAPALATVNQLSPIYVVFAIPERYLPELRMTGDKARVEAGPEGPAPVEGRVAGVDNAVDSTTGTIKVLGLFENKDEVLWPGSLVAVRLTLRIDQNVVVVPSMAVQTGQRGTFVYVIESGIALIRPVKVIRTSAGETVLSEGLAGNETVVTDGQLALRDRARVEVRPARGV